MMAKLERIKEIAPSIKKPLPALIFLLSLDWAVFVVSFSLYHVFRPDILAIAVYLSLFAYIFLTGRKRDLPYIIIASLMSLTWMLVSHDNYGYNRDLIVIQGYNIFPLFAWAAGLSGFYLIYLDLEAIFFRNGGLLKHFLIYSFLSLSLLISLETIAYHIFNIKNNATAAYSGLPLCDCIHAPLWMQISYLSIGPLYFLLCRFYDKKVRYDV
jgi:predicted neutral ceramidase superfamily lipid hydrolase